MIRNLLRAGVAMACLIGIGSTAAQTVKEFNLLINEVNFPVDGPIVVSEIAGTPPITALVVMDSAIFPANCPDEMPTTSGFYLSYDNKLVRLDSLQLMVTDWHLATTNPFDCVPNPGFVGPPPQSLFGDSFETE